MKKNPDIIDKLSKKFAREYSATGDNYFSSAEQFSKYLANHHIKSTVEIWHKYVLPNGMSSTDFFNLLRRLDFLINHEKLGMQVPVELSKEKATAAVKLKELTQNVKKLNPELKAVIVKPDLAIDFLDGVNFGFPPEDIAYFLSQYDQNAETRIESFDARSNQERTLVKIIGQAPGWIMAPDRMATLIDDIIKQSLQKILNRLHDDKIGVFRHNSDLKNGILKTKLSLQRSVPLKDIKFNLSGQEILDQRLGDIISCTGLTKAFLAAAQNSGLDLKAVITVNKESLDKGERNKYHIVPAVKMSDGKYHIIEPRCKSINGDCAKLLTQPVTIGQDVFHVLNSTKDKPYEIIAILSREELEQIKSLKAIKARNQRSNNFHLSENHR